MVLHGGKAKRSDVREGYSPIQILIVAAVVAFGFSAGLHASSSTMKTSSSARPSTPSSASSASTSAAEEPVSETARMVHAQNHLNPHPRANDKAAASAAAAVTAEDATAGDVFDGPGNRTVGGDTAEKVSDANQLPLQTGGEFYQKGYNIHGSDLSFHAGVDEPGVCCQLCSKHTECNGWTFVPPHKCFLKTANTPLEPAPKHSWISGKSNHCPPEAAAPSFSQLPPADLSRPARPFLIVTAASGNHLCALQQQLTSLAQYEGNTRVLVYDLNWEPKISADWLSKFNKNVIGPRWFNYSAYPHWFSKRLYYAWKVAVIKDAMDDFGGSVLWMDAGNVITSATGLDKVEELLEKDGFVSAVSSGSIAKYTHEGMFTHFGLNKEEMVATDRRITKGRGLACNGALVGFKAGTQGYKKIMVPWVACAYEKLCIAPHGSSRKNHRQDQSALTMLVSVLNDKEFRCTPGLIKHGLLTQEDHQAMGTCIEPPKEMIGDMPT